MRFSTRDNTDALDGFWHHLNRRWRAHAGSDPAASDSSLPATSDTTESTAAASDPVVTPADTTAPTTPSVTEEPATTTQPAATAPAITDPVTTSTTTVTTDPVAATAPTTTVTTDPVAATAPTTTATTDPVAATAPTTTVTTDPVVATAPTTTATTDPVAATAPTTTVTTDPVMAAPSTTSTGGTPVALTRHDGTVVAHSGDVIKDLDIYVNSGDGIQLDNADNVTISNVRIHYNGAGGAAEGSGISAMGADGLKIDHVEVFNAGAPASGAEVNAEHYGLALYSSPGAQISGVTTHDASTGIYLQDSPQALLTGIEGYNARGPEPRGQLVQFNRSGNSTLDTFYTYNDLEKSFTEDNINVGSSNNVTIKNGLIDGNNSPSGQGIIFEESTGGHVQNVDAVHMGNGAFADMTGGNSFDHVRSFDNFNTNAPSRGQPLSGGLIFALANGTSVTSASYQNPANPSNIAYGAGYENGQFSGTFDAHEVTGQTPMAAYHNTFGWA
ncbi:Parallel beta-helix repeat protein [Methylobacterium nodulans ORS 2060]|uniref:Parallel beta-helix repeat protein n=2 Tax=Methylobacterium nodulans TaxID=114616 RepID=B8IQD5_METNO|nr:Parallel beta-helix repeat protein [Methylobacterium nodulans ORS 2060]